MGSGELFIVLIAVLLLFRPKELQDILRKVARAMVEYKQAARKIEREVNEAINIKFQDVSEEKEGEDKENGEKLDRPKSAE